MGYAHQTIRAYPQKRSKITVATTFENIIELTNELGGSFSRVTELVNNTNDAVSRFSNSLNTTPADPLASLFESVNQGTSLLGKLSDAVPVGKIQDAFNTASNVSEGFFTVLDAANEASGGKLTGFQEKVTSLATGVVENMQPAMDAIVTGQELYNSVMDLATQKTAIMDIATRGLAAGQKILNIVMNMNPIGLVVLAITALIALVTIIIKKYNSWGASLALLLGPLGLIINLIQSFKRNWDRIKEAFSSGGIMAGLKAIGTTILDALLMPVQQLLSLLSKVPGLGNLASKGVDKIAALRARLGVTTEEKTKEKVPESKSEEDDSYTIPEIPKVNLAAMQNTEAIAGINNINASGTSQKVTNVTIEKLQDQTVINPQNTEEGLEEMEDNILKRLLQIMNNAQQIQPS